MIRRLIVLTGLALALTGMAWADMDGNPPNTPLSSSDTSATVTLDSLATSITFTNDGANNVVVYVWNACKTAAAVTLAMRGARIIKPGESFTFNHEPKTECGGGYKAFSHITTGAGLTTTSRWTSK